MKVVSFLPDFKPRSTLKDFWEGLKMWRLWSMLAWHDLIIRYRRSWIGVGWILLSFTFFIAVKITVFGFLSKQSIQFFAIYLSVGYLIYKFVTSIVADGANTFINSETWIKGESLPVSVYAYRAILRNFIVILMSAVPVIGVCLYVKTPVMVFMLSLIPALLLYAITAVWLSCLLGLLCTRHRDLTHLISTGMTILYYLTPVLWVPEDIPALQPVALYNPITHFIALLRDPLLYGDFPALSWMVAGGVSMTGLIVMLIIFGFFRHRIIFWI